MGAVFHNTKTYPWLSGIYGKLGVLCICKHFLLSIHDHICNAFERASSLHELQQPFFVIRNCCKTALLKQFFQMANQETRDKKLFSYLRRIFLLIRRHGIELNQSLRFLRDACCVLVLRVLPICNSLARNFHLHQFDQESFQGAFLPYRNKRHQTKNAIFRKPLSLDRHSFCMTLVTFLRSGQSCLPMFGTYDFGSYHSPMKSHNHTSFNRKGEANAA